MKIGITGEPRNETRPVSETVDSPAGARSQEFTLRRKQRTAEVGQPADPTNTMLPARIRVDRAPAGRLFLVSQFQLSLHNQIPSREECINDLGIEMRSTFTAQNIEALVDRV